MTNLQRDNAELIAHELKCWPDFFQAIIEGRKHHELRRDDRRFKVGDVILLREFDPEAEVYTGRQTKVRVTYTTADDNPCALSDFGLKNGFCILSIESLSPQPPAETGDDELVVLREFVQKAYVEGHNHGRANPPVYQHSSEDWPQSQSFKALEALSRKGRE